jgi:hypothetical protein
VDRAVRGMAPQTGILLGAVAAGLKLVQVKLVRIGRFGGLFSSMTEAVPGQAERKRLSPLRRPPINCEATR